MEALLKKQRAFMSEFSTFEKNYKKTSKTRHTTGYLEGRIKGFENIWKNLRENHIKIVESATGEQLKNPYFANDEYATLEELYYNLRGEFSDALEAVKTVNINTTTQNDLKLPRINIPTFNGNYLDWNSFRDLFSSLVHNNGNLSSVQKLHYLKCNLTGEAEQILRHLSITEANYDTAWKTLVDRYENERILVDAQINLLLSQAPIIKENAQALKCLLDTTNECLHSLKNLGLKTEYWDPIIVYITVKKLPIESHKLWESKYEGCKDLQTFKQLQDFIEGRFQTLERISEQQRPTTREFSNTSSKPLQNSLRKNHVKSFHVENVISCVICRNAHTARQCPEFLKLNPIQRQDLAISKGLCLNCLSRRHQINKCLSVSKCYVCGLKHHTLLHINKNNTNESSIKNKASHPSTNTVQNPSTQASTSRMSDFNTTEENSSFTGIHSYHTGSGPSKCVLLATALVKVYAANGNMYVLRALLDQGSQASFITEDAAQRLNLKRQSVISSITGLNNKEPVKSRGLLRVEMTSCTTESTKIETNLLILSSITNLLPPYVVCKQNWNHICELPLADPTYWKPGKIDILLGADVYADILLDGIVKGPTGSPLAQKTKLGWILSGSSQLQTNLRNIVSLHSRCELDQILRRFWEVEELHKERSMTMEEQKCETLFESSSNRHPITGRYTVSLPFADPSGHPTELGKSRDQAIKRFMYLEKRLEKNPELYKAYKNCIQEYLDLGHMEIAMTKESDHRMHCGDKTYYTSCYLPHHGVVKESSSTTKLRVVFDASSKTTSGVSLNEQLLVGPTIQQELIQILLRWRTHKVAFTADIAKMYRQIRVKPTDADYQRIVWRFHPSEEILDYRLLTVTFGTSSAPYLAIRTLQQLARDEALNYPIAARTTLRDFYVDDLMSGADTVDEAIELQSQLMQLTKAGGLSLRKWSCNFVEALQGIPSEDIECKFPLPIEINPTVKTLGTVWNPSDDSFQFKVSLPPAQKVLSKRNILSDIAHLFDPLGWISPTIIRAKIFMQVLWLRGLTWDEPVPDDIAKKWLLYRNELDKLELIRIPRWLRTHTKHTRCELHGFCDASQRAYAAVIYAKAINNDHSFINILISKTRVSPLKEISLPRLELCGAVLLSNLFNKVLSSLNLQIFATHAWCDSTIVLSWIRGHPNRWKSFVANRVTEITSILPPERWHHVSSQENPADCATRGMNPDELAKNSLWWNGPQWLRKEQKQWPTIPDIEIAETNEERRKSDNFKNFVAQSTTEESSILNRFSSFNKLVRVTAYLLRFRKNLQSTPNKREMNWLKSYELQISLQKLIIIAQAEMFSSEIHRLQNDLPVDARSPIRSLNPFLDIHGHLRVGGRLQEANLTFSQKHPIILTGKHSFTKLLIEHAHKTTLHGGISLMLAYLRRNYWIIDARNTLRRHIHKCIKCFRETAKPRTQLMGNLPRPRLMITRPFTHVGVDYAGPIEMKISKGRSNRFDKGYISLFICLSTKCIHLEAVSDLTTNAFLAAFRRFTSRRGLPSHVYSDCGTNFIGASKKLAMEQWRERIVNEQVTTELANNGVEWHFIPPASPHFGGLWEAGVKSMKFHLRRILGDTRLTFEELTTTLCQIEACLNSRPLCPITTDPTDLNVLTPGHFLMGCAPLTAPEPQLLDSKLHSLNRWQLLQRLYQTFWKKWSSEYLSRLQQRPKWTIKCPNIKKDDLVLLSDEHTPPCKWHLGRIVETHPGSDGLTRVVTVKTARSIIKRPITKVCLLPSTEEVN